MTIFTTQDADRILGLADSFMEDWEEHEGKDDPDCHERRKEFDAIRPLLAAAPLLLASLKECLSCLQTDRDWDEGKRARAAIKLAEGA
jgi:hypothetical protein